MRLPDFWTDDFYDVESFEYITDYTLAVEFSDGSERVIDFEPILYGPLFGPLRDIVLFKLVKIDPDLGTLVWPTGADIAPNVLHDWPRHVEAIVKRREKQFAASVVLVN
jgi:hypothetical protein